MRLGNLTAAIQDFQKSYDWGSKIRDQLQQKKAAGMAAAYDPNAGAGDGSDIQLNPSVAAGLSQLAGGAQPAGMGAAPQMAPQAPAGQMPAPMNFGLGQLPGAQPWAGGGQQPQLPGGMMPPQQMAQQARPPMAAPPQGQPQGQPQGMGVFGQQAPQPGMSAAATANTPLSQNQGDYSLSGQMRESQQALHTVYQGLKAANPKATKYELALASNRVIADMKGLAPLTKAAMTAQNQGALIALKTQAQEQALQYHVGRLRQIDAQIGDTEAKNAAVEAETKRYDDEKIRMGFAAIEQRATAAAANTGVRERVAATGERNEASLEGYRGAQTTSKDYATNVRKLGIAAQTAATALAGLRKDPMFMTKARTPGSPEAQALAKASQEDAAARQSLVSASVAAPEESAAPAPAAPAPAPRPGAAPSEAQIAKLKKAYPNARKTAAGWFVGNQPVTFN